jgi:hypothetical protein
MLVVVVKSERAMNYTAWPGVDGNVRRDTDDSPRSDPPDSPPGVTTAGRVIIDEVSGQVRISSYTSPYLNRNAGTKGLAGDNVLPKGVSGAP